MRGKSLVLAALLVLGLVGVAHADIMGTFDIVDLNLSIGTVRDPTPDTPLIPLTGGFLQDKAGNPQLPGLEFRLAQPTQLDLVLQDGRIIPIPMRRHPVVGPIDFCIVCDPSPVEILIDFGPELGTTLGRGEASFKPIVGTDIGQAGALQAGGFPVFVAFSAPTSSTGRIPAFSATASGVFTPQRVPEPSTLLLLGAGLAGMAAILRRLHG